MTKFSTITADYANLEFYLTTVGSINNVYLVSPIGGLVLGGGWAGFTSRSPLYSAAVAGFLYDEIYAFTENTLPDEFITGEDFLAKGLFSGVTLNAFNFTNVTPPVAGGPPRTADLEIAISVEDFIAVANYYKATRLAEFI